MRSAGTFAALLAISILAAAPPARAQDRWTEIRSPHFRVLTDSSPADARKVAEQFEQMRYVIHWRFPGSELESGVPLTIVAARNEDTARGLLPKEWKGSGPKPAGLFIANWERNLALIRLDLWDGYAQSVVYHEYTHSVLHRNAHWLPMWLDEGMAEFFSTTRFEAKQIVLGAAPARFRVLDSRSLKPVATMLDLRQAEVMQDDRTVQIFYAEAWAMIHYMTFGPGMESGKLLSNFYQRVQAGSTEGGTEQKKAFVAVFGNLDLFDASFRTYLGKFLLNAAVLPPPPPLAASSFTERKLTPAETRYEQGAFHISSGDPAGGRSLIEQALALDPKLAAAHEELGFLNYDDGRDAQAHSEWQTAYALDSALYRSLFAETITGVSFRDQTLDQRNATLESLRKVVHANLRFAPGYVKLAILFWWQGDMDAAYRAAHEAEQLEPWRPGYHLLTAQILLAQKKNRQAAAIARSTAELYTSTDRYEAVQLWQQIPPADRSDGPPLSFDLPAGARTMDGTMVSSACGDPVKAGGAATKSKGFALVLQPAGSPSQAPLQLTSAGPRHSGFADTFWIGAGHFADFFKCFHAAGQPALVAYTPGAANRGELLWIDLHEDLPGPGPQQKEPAHPPATP